MILIICRLLEIQRSVEDFSNEHADDYNQRREIFHWEALNRIESVLECGQWVSLKL